MKFEMDGRVAIVTGGAGGIGRAIAHRLADSGVHVALWDRDVRGLVAAAREVDGCATFPVDVSDEGSVGAAMAATVARFERLDILINGAGVMGPSLPLERTEYGDWRRTIAINLDSVFLCSKASIDHLRASPFGRIVNISSIAGKEGNANMVAYSAAKAGMIAVTKSLGKELAQSKVRVHCIAPGVIETPLNRQVPAEVLDAVIAKIPLGRCGHPEEVAALAIWLCSDECTFSTGATFDLSGGRATY